MLLSDTAVVRPVFASVLALLLVLFGIVAYTLLPLREYPDIDPPVVSIDTTYRGASASVVETQVTELIEGSISGVEGIQFIESSSQDGRSVISVRFGVNHDIEAATNDIRDRVFTILSSLPAEADPPRVRKVDGNQDVIIWYNLTSSRMSVPELTDYAERYLVDRFSILDGVADVRIGGAQSYAMRIWLDRQRLAAHGLTVADVEAALRRENIELPAGAIESRTRQFTLRVERTFRTADDFQRLVLARGDEGYLVRLADVARVERGVVEDRTFFRGNQVPMVGIGIIRQSTANTLDVGKATRITVDELNASLPDGMEIKASYDGSVFVQGAIREVYHTLVIAIVLVVLAIFLFLGSPRAILIPAVTVPVSITATFIALMLFGFTVNLFTLLALVLAIGLVVDDAIIVLENIRRRIDELGETPLVAAYYGTRQVAFAVISTTLVLIAVFVPISFLEGDIGRLFSEFALTMAAAVAFSSFVALSLSPMLASKLLKSHEEGSRLARWVESMLFTTRRVYATALTAVLKVRWLALLVFFALFGAVVWLFGQLPGEYAPREDRGTFFVMVNGPEGATYEYMEEYMTEIETRMMKYVENGEVSRLLVRTPRGWGSAAAFNNGILIVVLEDWSDRRSGWEIISQLRNELSDLSGVRAFPIMRQGFGGQSQPVQFVLGGASSYDELAEWRDILLARLAEDNPGLVNIDWDYKETQPQLSVQIDYDRAAELGVSVAAVGATLESLLGSRRVTTFIDEGREYDVIVQGERDLQRTATSLDNIYVRSSRSNELIPLANLVELREYAGSTTLNRYNRIRSITISAALGDGLALGDALAHLEGLARDHLPESLIIDYKGQSRDFYQAGSSLMFVFVFGLIVVFLVLAAQFESFVHPLVIMLGVPMAVGGGLLGLWLTGNTLNLYSQIGLVMLIGLAAKNGILIVEFANQLRDAGKPFDEAIIEASVLRLRPIVMTGVTTAAGALPLVMAFGAGSETRSVIGVVVLFGVLASMVLTLFLIPVLYSLMARNTGSPHTVAKRLKAEESQQSAT